MEAAKLFTMPFIVVGAIMLILLFVAVKDFYDDYFLGESALALGNLNRTPWEKTTTADSFKAKRRGGKR